LFVNPLRAIVSDDILVAIFSNLDSIICCNQEFLAGLLRIFPRGERSIDSDAVIGAEFTKMAEYFKMYKVYCSNQQKSLDTIDQQCRKSMRFRERLQVWHNPSTDHLLLVLIA
jgi:hypothetical protein